MKTTAANGLSWTLTQDEDGNGVVDNTQNDAIVLNADGSTTETYTDTNGSLNSSPDGKTDSITEVTTTSANGLSKTVVTTGTNDDYSDSNTLTDSKVINADGGTTEAITVTTPGSNNQPVARDTKTVNTSANGLSRNSQLSAGGYVIASASATTASDGSTTDTATLNNPNGTLYEEDVTTTSANGQSFSLQSARNGSSSFNHFETISTNVDGSVTDTVWDTNPSGVTTGEIITNTSANGLSKTVQTEPDGGGVVEQTLSDATALNADGSKTLVQTVFNANGTLRSRDVRTTSANGLNITTTYDVNGDGALDETTADNTVFNADGSKTETVTTTYANGTEKSQSVTTTSANGLNVTTTTTIVGYATITDSGTVSSSGAKTETVKYNNASNSLVSSTVTTTSGDGRTIVVQHYNSSNTLTSKETTLNTAGANGSYQWTNVNASGTVLNEANHFIDANGVDSVTLYIGSTKYTATLTTAQEASVLAAVKNLYDAVLDRAPTTVELQTWLQYYTASGMNFTSLANAIISSTEFSQKYGTSLTKAEFVEQIYQNALGRNATMSELSNWLSQLAAGTVTEAALAIAVSQSAEHIADGNVYQVTNNTYNTTGTYTLDHTTDTAVAGAIVQNLYKPRSGGPRTRQACPLIRRTSSTER